ncbi:MAG TPA: SGNH/GDSL hydrolase family protein [Nocardioides sp.]|nr:SGNH/GDSL hydrolase family protein [Nocardioides sp.]
MEPEVHRYVALGDSYTSGAGLAQAQRGSGGCERSRLNYPTLVATELGADLKDVSCGGATTGNATSPQPTRDGGANPPQLDSLTRATDLVTVGLGYNDLDFFGGLVLGCPSVAADDPEGHPCEDANAGQDRQAVVRSIGDAVEATLKAVHDRSPDARVLLVGYPQLVPAEGTCPELPLAAGDYPFVRSSLELLDTELRRAAEAADATYVDVMAASAGHDICAGRAAWVHGATAQPDVAAAYHPFASEHRAVADLILEELGRHS